MALAPLTLPAPTVPEIDQKPHHREYDGLGAGKHQRARQIALSGATIAFILTEVIGLTAAVLPEAWMELFTAEPSAIAAGSVYLRIVGPFYGFFGLGLSLYFALQGAGRMFWPILAGIARVAIAIGGGFIALRYGGSLVLLFAVLAASLCAYGTMIFASVWFGRSIAEGAAVRRVGTCRSVGRK
jgi:Na+-driven multidrug efflux pump